MNFYLYSIFNLIKFKTNFLDWLELVRGERGKILTKYLLVEVCEVISRECASFARVYCLFDDTSSTIVVFACGNEPSSYMHGQSSSVLSLLLSMLMLMFLFLSLVMTLLLLLCNRLLAHTCF